MTKTSAVTYTATVTAIGPRELAKADANPAYTPQEYLLDEFEVTCELEAQRIIKLRKARGTYPQTAALAGVR